MGKENRDSNLQAPGLCFKGSDTLIQSLYTPSFIHTMSPSEVRRQQIHLPSHAGVGAKVSGYVHVTDNGCLWEP